MEIRKERYLSIEISLIGKISTLDTQSTTAYDESRYAATRNKYFEETTMPDDYRIFIPLKNVLLWS